MSGFLSLKSEWVPGNVTGCGFLMSWPLGSSWAAPLHSLFLFVLQVLLWEAPRCTWSNGTAESKSLTDCPALSAASLNIDFIKLAARAVLHLLRCPTQNNPWLSGLVLLHLMWWHFESMGTGAETLLPFRRTGALLQARCGHQKWCFCWEQWALGHECRVCSIVGHFFCFSATWFLGVPHFSKMGVLRLTFLQSCFWRCVHGETQCSLEPASQT